MLKFIFKITFISAILFIFAGNLFILPAKANDYQLSTLASVANYDAGNSIESIIENVLKITLSLMGILFLAFAVFAGMRWMTAQGNEEHVTTAKDTLEAAAIGLVIVACSYAITTLIFSKLGG